MKAILLPAIPWYRRITLRRAGPSQGSLAVLAPVLALIALGFALRLYNLGGESLWYDELLELDIAQGPLAWLLPRLRGHTGVPLDYLLLHGWLWLGGSEAWVRLPAVIWSTMTLALAYRLARRWLNRTAGLLLLALLVLSPLQVYYSQEARPYALVALGITLALDAFWRLRQTGRWVYLLPLLDGVLVAAMSHIFSMAIFGPLLLFAGLDLLICWRRPAVVALVGLVLTALLPLLVLLALGWSDILFYTSAGFGQALVEPEKFTVEASQKPNQGQGPEISWPFIRREVLGPLGAGEEPFALWLLNGLAAAGFLSLMAQKKYRQGLLLGLWLVLPVVIILAFLVYRGTFFAVRYVLYVLPAYWLLISVGLLALPRRLLAMGRPRLAAALFLLLAGLVLLAVGPRLYRLYTLPDKENWRLVTEFIRANTTPGDAVIALRAEPATNWYGPSAWTPPNYYQDLETVQTAVAKSRRSWVILSIFSSGMDGKIKAWLGEQQAVRFVLDPVIHVYYLGPGVPHDQLLTEIQDFALPVDHALYASLARENRHRPAVARRYYELAIAHAPDEATRAEYQGALHYLK